MSARRPTAAGKGAGAQLRPCSGRAQRKLGAPGRAASCATQGGRFLRRCVLGRNTCMCWWWRLAGSCSWWQLASAASSLQSRRAPARGRFSQFSRKHSRAVEPKVGLHLVVLALAASRASSRAMRAACARGRHVSCLCIRETSTRAINGVFVKAGSGTRRGAHPGAAGWGSSGHLAGSSSCLSGRLDARVGADYSGLAHRPAERRFVAVGERRHRAGDQLESGTPFHLPHC